MSLDSQGANTFGIALRAAMMERGLRPFAKGDFVSIAVFANGATHQITGRASRPWTAYFRISDLAAIGLDVHTAIFVCITAINGHIPTTPSPNPEDATVTEARDPATPHSANVDTHPEELCCQVGTAHSVTDTGGNIDGDEAGDSNEPRSDLIPFDPILDRDFEAEDNPLDRPSDEVAARIGALLDAAKAQDDAKPTTGDDEIGWEPDESSSDLDLPPEPRF